LIEHGLTRELSTTIDLEYRPTGLFCTLSFALPEAEVVDYCQAEKSSPESALIASRRGECF
jgi:hypothetical protein